MEPLQVETAVGRTAVRLLLVAAALLAGTAGCVTTESLRVPWHTEPPPAPCQVAGMWYPEVHFEPDPAHNGEKVPGLAGRVFVFGEEAGKTLVVDGELIVDLFDDTPAGRTVRQGMPVERWRIDPATLKRLRRKDSMFGWGYTVFLPWPSYRPETDLVHLKITFTPVGGTPLYSETPPLSLKGGNSITVHEPKTVIWTPEQGVIGEQVKPLTKKN